jgi:hypothetical protein
MDVERTIEFLLEQQSRFLEQLSRSDERQARFESDMLQINSILVEVATTQERTNEIVAALAEQLVELSKRQRELSEVAERRHAELTEQQRITEQNLNSLIAVVERHISGHS